MIISVIFLCGSIILFYYSCVTWKRKFALSSLLAIFGMTLFLWGMQVILYDYAHLRGLLNLLLLPVFLLLIYFIARRMSLKYKKIAIILYCFIGIYLCVFIHDVVWLCLNWNSFFSFT